MTDCYVYVLVICNGIMISAGDEEYRRLMHDLALSCVGVVTFAGELFEWERNLMRANGEQQAFKSRPLLDCSFVTSNQKRVLQLDLEYSLLLLLPLTVLALSPSSCPHLLRSRQ